MLLLNPRRRRKARKAKRSRRSRRPMTAKQLKFFGPRKARRSRRRTITMHANPAPRRSRRSRRRSLGAVTRRFRRNPISGTTIRASMGSITRSIGNAAVGAAGAVAVDVAMGQAGRFLPASVMARYNAAGGINPMYYVAKGGLALAVGILGAKFLPGKMKGIAAKAAEGSLTVQGYEVLRAMVPASVMLGFYSPARITSLPSNGMGRMGRVGAYLPRGRTAAAGMARIAGSSGPASIGGTRNSEGYAL